MRAWVLRVVAAAMMAGAGCQKRATWERHYEAACSYWEHDDIPRAFDAATRALYAAQREGASDSVCAIVASDAADLAYRHGDLTAAEHFYHETLGYATGVGGRWGMVHLELARMSLAHVYEETGHYAEARSVYAQCVADAPPGNGWFMDHQRSLARNFATAGMYAQADSAYANVIVYLEARHGAHHPITDHVVLERGKTLRAAGRRDEARAVWRSLLASLSTRRTPEYIDNIRALSECAAGLRSVGEVSTADSLDARVATLNELRSRVRE